MWTGVMVNGSETFTDYLQSIKRRSDAPGSIWKYRSIDTGVLGMILNRTTGQPLSTMLSGKIWQPLGMEQDATWLRDKSGLETAFCCINATLRDYGRFGLMMLNRRQGRGKASRCRKVDCGVYQSARFAGQLWSALADAFSRRHHRLRLSVVDAIRWRGASLSCRWSLLPVHLR
jgi:CubicO group peptidase (beta-lactamase class C family)